MATTPSPPVPDARRRIRRTAQDYKTACFCVLDVELEALRAMLDEVHEDLPLVNSHNVYILGELSEHNVVIAILPAIGNNDSGAVAKQLRVDFPLVQHGFLVGVGGGVPMTNHGICIRLGDVVVGEASSSAPAVIQFDRGKLRDNRELDVVGHLNKPPQLLVGAVKKLKAQHRQDGSQIPSLIANMIKRYPRMEEQYRFPGTEQDQLFHSSYEHVSGSTCQDCDRQMLVKRDTHDLELNRVLYGTIGSSNSVVRNAVERDRLAKKYGVICVEMEAAGLVDQLPCLVVRGICDYSDSHKNKQWQPYAAAAAVAYVKELLGTMRHGDSSQSNMQLNGVSQSSQAATDLLDSLISNKTEAKLILILKSLSFQRIDARLRSISQAMPHTCTWLAAHQSFRDWNDTSQIGAHHGFLWIKGKPGSGKSTLMKSLLNTEKRKQSRQIVIAYFFNAHALGELEKSSLGLYRSLTHQLVAACPYLEERLLEWFSAKESDGVVDDWTADELKEFLVAMISDQLRQPVLVVIDALDEGQESDVRQLVAFLEDFASHAYLNQRPLRICLSSRHYPHISVKRGITIALESQEEHDDDVKRYIREKMPDDQSPAAGELREKLWLKSAKIFLWVVLVIPLLKEAHDHGDQLDATAMSQHLDSIPAELDDLFVRILARSAEDLGDCVTTLQWVLFSQRPLSLTALYVAVSITSTSARFDADDVRPERVTRCLTNASRGLTEISEGPSPTVQFIHEAVRDFLKKSGLARIDPTLSGNIEGLSHERIMTSCYTYIVQHKLRIPDVLLSTTKSYKTQRTEVCSDLPLLQYAALYMFRHAELAENHQVSRKEFLEQLTDKTGGLSAWIRARNIFERARINRYTLTAPLCYVLVDQGFDTLVELLHHEHCSSLVSSERYGTALQAACMRGNERIAAFLVDRGHNVNAEGGQYENALFAAIESKSKSLVDFLLQNGCRPPVEALQKRIFQLIDHADAIGVQALIDAGCPTECKRDSDEMTPLVYAVSHTWDQSEPMVQIVQSLIKAGADIDAGTSYEGTALQIAASSVNHVVIRLLLEGGADVNVQSGCHGSALQAAINTGDDAAIRLVLEAGAEVNAQGDWGSPLETAIRLRNRRAVRLLLDAGADAAALDRRQRAQLTLMASRT